MDFDFSFLNSESFWITIVSAGIIAWVSARMTISHSNQKFDKEHNKACIEKAIELAEVYANDMLHCGNYICNFYSRNKVIADFYAKVNAKRLEENLLFTKEELDSILEEVGDADVIRTNFETEYAPLSLFLASRKLLKKPSDLSEFNLDFSEDELNKPLVELDDKRLKEALYEEHYNTIYDTKNKLEYFSMYFTSKVADSDAVYQSLHQTFLACITYLYFGIADINTDPKEKYYTNIIALFDIWNKKYMDSSMRQQELLKRKKMRDKEEFEGVVERPKEWK